MHTYRHAGLPLTAAIAAELLREALETSSLSDNFSRKQAELCVRALHAQRGGVPSPYPQAVFVKTPLQTWKNKGWVTNPRPGRYLWLGATDLNEHETELSHECPELANEHITSYVYMFYYHTDRSLAELQGRQHWPCKIGKTFRAPAHRISEQFNSHYHSKPSVAVVWPTDNPTALEKAAHAMLELRGRKVPNSVGTEWFYTNPDELTTLLSQLDSE